MHFSYIFNEQLWPKGLPAILSLAEAGIYSNVSLPYPLYVCDDEHSS